MHLVFRQRPSLDLSFVVTGLADTRPPFFIIQPSRTYCHSAGPVGWRRTHLLWQKRLEMRTAIKQVVFCDEFFFLLLFFFFYWAVLKIGAAKGNAISVITLYEYRTKLWCHYRIAIGNFMLLEIFRSPYYVTFYPWRYILKKDIEHMKTVYQQNKIYSIL